MGFIFWCICSACFYRNIYYSALCAVPCFGNFSSRRTRVRPDARNDVHVNGIDVRRGCFISCGGPVCRKKKSHHVRLENIQKQMEKNGFFYIFMLRILPINFDLISYAAGISNIKPWTYLAATAAGIIPGTIALNVLGASFFTGNVLVFSIVIVIYIIFLTLPFVFKKKMPSLFH